MLASLTWTLIVEPGRGWPRLSRACERADALPDPAAHAAGVGAIVAGCVLLGTSLREDVSVGFVIVSVLAAIAGYVGSAALTVAVVPRWFASTTLARGGAEARPTPDGLSRFASAAGLPVIASGVAHAIPLWTLQVTAVLFGAALTYRSGSLGARAFLGMEGASRKRVATLTALVSTLPALCAALFIALR